MFMFKNNCYKIYGNSCTLFLLQIIFVQAINRVTTNRWHSYRNNKYEQRSDIDIP